MLITLLIILAWYVSGVCGFLYWWTKDYDFTDEHVLTAIVAGILGPLSLLFGLIIHGKKDRVIFKRRGGQNE